MFARCSTSVTCGVESRSAVSGGPGRGGSQTIEEVTMRGRTIGSTLFGVGLLFAASSCSDLQGDGQSSASFALGDALPGTNATTFAAAKTNFQAAEGAPDGLGPIFNERSCMFCH